MDSGSDSVRLQEISEHDGVTVVRVAVDGDAAILHVGRCSARLPPTAIQAVMQRYGKPLQAPLETIERIALPGGTTLARARFRPRYDVIAKDYAVWTSEGGETFAELSVTVAAALRFLVKDRLQ